MGYYAQFPMPIPHLGVRSMLLLTLPPLIIADPFDLHALTMPPAFNLSQNQTLHLFAFFHVRRRVIGSESLDSATVSFFFEGLSWKSDPAGQVLTHILKVFQ